MAMPDHSRYQRSLISALFLAAKAHVGYWQWRKTTLGRRIERVRSFRLHSVASFRLVR